MAENRTVQHKRKSPAILSRIVILLFLMMLLLFVNINSITHFFNRSSYEAVTATVIRPTTDDFLLLIPKVELSYQYKGQQYTDTKYFVLAPLFGLSSEEGEHLTIYVNTFAPNHSLFQVNFFRNILNWIFLLLMIACIINLVHRIRKYFFNKAKRNGGTHNETKME